MKLKNNILQVNVILQDRMREKIANLGLKTLEASNVVLGDSDIDYNLIENNIQSRILSAPYGNVGIKSPFIYNGTDKSLEGIITCFARKVVAVSNTDSTGKIQSLYDYNTSDNFSDGVTVPTLTNGKNIEEINFLNQNIKPEGYILYFQTVLTYALDENGINQRVNEGYNFFIVDNTLAVQSLPNLYSLIIDEENSSLLISKKVSSLNRFLYILAKGKVTKKQKLIKFNW